MKSETCSNLARISLVTAFAAVLCGCCLNITIINNPDATTEPDRFTKLMIGLIPVGITVVGLICGLLATAEAAVRKHQGVLPMAIAGIVLNTSFLAFVIYSVVTIVKMFEDGRLPAQ